MLEWILFLAIVVLALFLVFLLYRLQSLRNSLSDLEFRKGSQSVKYGKLTEQWIPFSEKFPFPSNNFRFLGNPIDGIAFNDDKIVFCEFKANTAGLSEKQKRIRELVQNKKVEWLELRVE
ncbi:MAG: Holliday junction resolvase-like protein [Candidatus ainarchaeum sp.]|nr:Holliday junction resolvase-like protein [Candidatus ainarchaeum sp.]